MREVVSIHVGQFGVEAGKALWELYCLEHGVLPDGTLTGSVTDHPGFEGFFQERKNDTYSPRTIFTDLDPTKIDEIRRGKYRNLFMTGRLTTGVEDAANNYARGRYTVGQELIEVASEAIRSHIEECDQLTGFKTFHSLGGGTGSGFNTLISEMLNTEYRKKGLIEVALFPSSLMATSVVEPYNTVLATNAAMDKSNCVILIDNEAMNNICTTKLNFERSTHKVLNRLLAQAISTTTCSIRFGSEQHTDFMDFHTNLVPFPRLHFPIFSLSPLNSPGVRNTDSINTIEMTSNCFDKQYRMAICDNEEGLYMACCLMYRGDAPSKEIHQAIAVLKNKIKFVGWSPTGFKIGVSYHPPVTVPGSPLGKCNRLVCMLSNNTATHKVWQNLYKKYQVMASKGAFYHWYLSEGMEEEEFVTAGDNIKTLIADYDGATTNEVC